LIINETAIENICRINTKSINPQDYPNEFFIHYSLPAFDNNKSAELQQGKDILSNKYLITEPCVLFNKLNIRFKRIWLITDVKERMICSTEFLPLVPVNIDLDYFYYLLLDDNFTVNLISESKGTSNSHQRIKPKDLMDQRINIIEDIDLQKAIAHKLKILDQKIDSNQRGLIYLEELIKILYKSWFNDFQFPGGTCELMQEVPKEWKISNVYDNVIEIREKNLNNNDFPVLSVVKEGKFRLSEDVFTKQVYSKSTVNYKIVRRNQVAYNPARANIGSIAMLTDFDVGLVSPIYVVFELKETITPTFFYYYMKQPMFLKNIKHHAIGTTRQNFPFEAFKMFNMVVPPMELQLRFEEIAKPIEQKIAKLKEENAVLAEIRDTLLPKLISGELPVEVGEA
jgi:type I restriction enzyme S subunit